MGPGVAVALDVVLQLLDRAALIGGMIGKAQAEKRDLTEAELNQLAAADDAAKARLDSAIKQAQSQGR